MQLEHLVDTLGLPGLAIGAAFEGDVLTFAGGILSHRGHFGFESAALAASLGAAFADNAVFLSARYFRGSRVVRWMLDKPGLKRFHARLDTNPALAILGFRFLYGMKTAGAAMIGMTGVSWLRFAALDALAVLLWAHLLVALGYWVGSSIETLFGRMGLHWHMIVALGIFAVAAVVYWYVSRHSGKAGAGKDDSGSGT